MRKIDRLKNIQRANILAEKRYLNHKNGKGLLIEDDSIPKSLVTEASIDELINQYVDSGKLTQQTFNKIVDASNQKSAYTTWLAKKVADKIIKDEDVYKFKEYFLIFDKNKKLYPNADLNQYKTSADVQTFISITQKIRDKETEITGGDVTTSDGKNLATPNEVRKLESVGIEFLGMQDGYQIFKVPQSLKGNKEGWRVYKEILGRCAGRGTGAKIDICTMASDEYFDQYLEDGPYYVIFNLNDPQSPYQFHYELSQFMDKNNNSVI